MSTYNLEAKQGIIFLMVIALLPSVFALGDGTVSLSATVVAPDYTVYMGRGYLNIENQGGIGLANLKIPDSIHDPVRLEIMKGNQISKIWSWNIVQHSHSERAYKNYDYTKDTYECIDISGRTMTITVQGYYRKNSQRITAIAYGTGALFSGRLR